MAMKDIIARIRTERGLTQEQMARDLYVTRQAVSRWETGETQPGIDMVKLICVTYGVPLERFFEMPMEYYCQCCSLPIPDPSLHGTEADGQPSQNYCKFCYQHGDFTAKDVDMDEFIEATAQMEADALGISREEAVSLMGTLLPHLARWKEAKDRWGDTEAYKEYEQRVEEGADMNASGKELMEFLAAFGTLKELDPEGPEAQAKAAELQQFITDRFYTCTKEILAGLGKMYVADERFKQNIDDAGGEGTAEFVSKAIAAYCRA